MLHHANPSDSPTSILILSLLTFTFRLEDDRHTSGKEAGLLAGLAVLFMKLSKTQVLEVWEVSTQRPPLARSANFLLALVSKKKHKLPCQVKDCLQIALKNKGRPEMVPRAHFIDLFSAKVSVSGAVSMDGKRIHVREKSRNRTESRHNLMRKTIRAK